MIHKLTGKVAYVVMSFGGFLGLGERYHPLPWGLMEYDPDRKGYVVDLTEEQLLNAPHFGPGEESVLGHPEYATELYTYYGVTPFQF